jgi:hypothetical protein
MLALWFGIERRRFKGPPTGQLLQARQEIIRAEEAAIRQSS